MLIPAAPGMPEDEIETPALVLDLDVFEGNLDRMARLLEPTGTRLRAHAKTHKSPVIAHLQIARGAVGQCVQKVGEAEILAWGGVPDILVSNEVVGSARSVGLFEGLKPFLDDAQASGLPADKVLYLCTGSQGEPRAALSRIARMAICADDPKQVADLAAAAQVASTRLTVLVEIDVGAGRCGVNPGHDAVDLAQSIAASPHLRFGGLQAYHGSAQHLRRPEQREAAIAGASEACRRTVEQLRQQGLDCPIVGGGGTGTFALEAASGIYNEIQAGSYIFMDADYGRNFDAPGAAPAFGHALFVLTTVMSAPRPGIAVVDAGLKALAFDSGLPLVWQRPDWRYVGASDEHGKIEVPPEAAAAKLGEKLRLVPGHCDPTVDRHEWYVGVRRGRVECVWPVAARGAFF